MAWKCKKCGSKNIEVEVIIDSTITYSVDKNGKPSELRSFYYNNLDELAIAEGEIYMYYCGDCGNSSEKIEDIADWVDE